MKEALLFLVLVTGGLAQVIPIFEPLSSSNGIETYVDERPPVGMEVVVVRARGPLSETVLYGIDLPPGSEEVFQINSTSGNITVGLRGPTSLVVRNQMQTIFRLDVFAYYLSSGINGSRAYITLTVIVRDVNDAPMFSQRNYTIAVIETTTIGTVIGSFVAMDGDLSDSGIVTYSLMQLSPVGVLPSFTISTVHGDLMLSRSVNVNTNYQLMIVAVDAGTPPLNDTTMVTVKVDPLPPVFQLLTYSASVPEFTGVQNPVTLTTVIAIDRTSGNSINIFYSISSFIPANNDVTFAVGATTGIITVNGTLDRETLSRYLVTVEARSVIGSSTFGQTTVIVDLTDINEPPVFVSSHYITSVSEGTMVGEVLFSGIVAVDNDEGPNSTFSYSILAIYGHQTLDGSRIQITDPFFNISSISGIITVNTNLEREAMVDGFHYYEIIVAATDRGSPPLTSSTTLTVSVIDVNDNPPQFNSTFFNFQISENLPAGAVVGALEVTDRDQGLAAETTFTLTGQGSDRFTVETVNVTQMSNASSQPPVVTIARVITTQLLDREDIELYQFFLTAQDQTNAPLLTTVPVNITVLDDNDNDPIFPRSSYVFSISETTSNLLVMEFTVTDADSGRNGEVVFNLDPTVSSLFSLVSSGPFSTELYISHSLDREVVDSYLFTLFARDRGSPARTGQTQISITITDENDNPPVFNSTSFVYAVSENVPLGTVVGGFEATDSDLGAGGQISIFSITGDYSDRFTIQILGIGTPEMGGRIVTAQSLDREDVSFYQLVLVAGDGGSPRLFSSVPLTVAILDVNDNSPVFNRSNWMLNLLENTNNTFVMEFTVSDADFGNNAAVDFSLDPTVNGLFSLQNSGPLSTMLYLTHYLDREATSSYSFTISARDRGVPSLLGQTTVTVNVTDENDNPPILSVTSLTLDVIENTPIGTILGDFEVTDIDSSLAAESNFSLSGMNAERFSAVVVSVSQRLNPQSTSPSTITRGRIITAQLLDREERDSYQLMLIAEDRSDSPLSASVPVTLTVLDANDNPPTFAQSSWNFRLQENINSVLIMIFNATDQDIGSNGELDFSLDASAQGLFSLTSTGPLSTALFLSHQLDREATPLYNFRLFGIDRGTPSIVGDTEITVTVLDENDNSPIFNESNYEITIAENLPPGTLIGRVVAMDADAGSNGRVAYYNSPQQLVAINSTTGELYLLVAPDFESFSMQTLQVTAVDFGRPQRNATTTVTVIIADANDFPPVFQRDDYNMSITEDVILGSQVIRVTATDGDGDSIAYAIIDGDELEQFAIENTTGFITVNRSLDRESIDSYTLTVLAVDNGMPAMSSMATVTVSVIDINDNSPRFIGEPYAVEINEGLDGSEGADVFTVLAIDPDFGQNGEVTYLVLGLGTQYFNINQSTGEITVSSQGVDFEIVNSMMNPVVITLIAEDDGSPMRFSVSTISITVTDSNDNSPVFINAPYSTTMPEGFIQSRQQVLVLNATDADSGTNGEITYSIAGGESGNFEIDSMTGAVYLQAGVIFDREASTIPHNDNGDAVFTFGIAAMDSAIPALITYTTVSLLISDVNDNSPVFQSSLVNLMLSESLPVGTAISNLVATDGDFGTNGMVNYTILREESLVYGVITQGFTVAVDSSTGVLTLVRSLDREVAPTFNISIAAQDQGLGNNQAIAIVVINVTDSNDNRPIFSVPSGGYMAVILENSTTGSEVIIVTATDIDQGPNQVVTYTISANNSVPFSIPDPTVGRIIVSGLLDRENVPEYQVVVIARDSAVDSLESFATIRVIIEDVNDNAPDFRSDSYSAMVAEGLPRGAVVQVNPPIMASDPDITPFFYALGGEGSANFSINNLTGVITTEETLDYEQIQEYPNLILIVYDVDLLNSTRSLRIIVQDNNDNSPTFSSNRVQLFIHESTPLGSEVFIAMATDLDSTVNGQVIYSIMPSEEFQINPLSGAITVETELDFETESSYTLTVIASDGGTPARNSTLIIIIGIIDQNDNSPVITSPTPSYSIRENVGVGTFVGSVNATDADNGTNSAIVFTIIAGNIANRFYIDSVTGDIFTNGTIDREELSLYSLTVEARDSAVFSLSDQTIVMVFVTDENDNIPSFSTFPNPVISELMPSNTEVIFLNAIDDDEGTNSAITYSLVSLSGVAPFAIGASSGIISTTSTLDYEITREYNLFITATDSGTPPMSADISLNIMIMDENDNTPQFSRRTYIATIPENSQENSVVIALEATDIDSGSNAELLYSITDANMNSIFLIDNSSGIVTVGRSAPLDFETTRMFVVPIQVEDMGSPALFSQAILIVNLTDVNDNQPEFSTIQAQTIEENRVSGSTITIVTVTDADQGVNAAISYSIIGGDTMEQFDILQDGSVILRSMLDYETTPSYNIVIEAEDGGFPPLTARGNLVINLIDVNDNSPVFSGSQTVFIAQENVSPGTEVVKFQASDLDSGNNGNVVFRLVNGGGANSIFNLNPTSGSLTAEQSLDRETTSQYTLIAEVADSGMPPLSTQREITINVADVNDNSPVFAEPPTFMIMESLNPFSIISVLMATDADEGSNAITYYFVTGGSNTSYISVSPRGVVTLRRNVDYDIGERELSVEVSALNQNQDPGSTCSFQLCTTTTLILLVEDENDNTPVFTQSDYHFSVNRSFLTRGQIIGRVEATDRDSNNFGLVRYQIAQSSMFTIGVDSGAIELQQYSPETDPNFIEFRVDGIDNMGEDPTFMSSSLVKVYFIEDENLVIFTIDEQKSIVDSNLAEIERFLVGLSSGNIALFLYDTREYIITMEVNQANNRKRQTETITITRTNVTVFGTNNSTRVVLNSTDLFPYINENIGSITTIGPYTIENIQAYPLPLTAENDDNQFLIYILIAAGAAGAVILVFLLVVIILCCCLVHRGKRKKYHPSEKASKSDRKKQKRGFSKDPEAYENPAWDDPYGNDWTQDVAFEMPSTFNERSVDVINDSQSKAHKSRTGKKWQANDYSMNGYSSQNFDEVSIEIKPDQQSLSHASTTLERRSKDAEKDPLIHSHPPPPPQTGFARNKSREMDDMRVRPVLDITAPEDDEDKEEESKSDEEEDIKVDLGRDAEEESEDNDGGEDIKVDLGRGAEEESEDNDGGEEEEEDSEEEEEDSEEEEEDSEEEEDNDEEEESDEEEKSEEESEESDDGGFEIPDT